MGEQRPKSEADPDTWDKLKKKPIQPDDDPRGIKLGKGKKPVKDDENDLKLKANQKPKPSEPETSIHLKPFAGKEQEPNIKPDAEEMMPAPVQEELEKGKKTETA